MSHAYAEAGLGYKLAVMQNKITVSDNLISRRIHDQSYSLAGLTNFLLTKCLTVIPSYECHLVIIMLHLRSHAIPFVLCVLFMYLLH